MNGLDVTCANIKPVVDETNPALSQQIDTGLDALVASVGDLYRQEQQGQRFSLEDADILGNKAQEDAVALAGQIA